MLQPQIRLLADEQLSGAALENVQKRLALWMDQHVKKLLGPLAYLELAEGIEGIARGIAYQVAEALGVLDRTRVGGDLRALDQDGRAALRKLGVRFGAYHLYLPALLKPAPRGLAAQLWMLKHESPEAKGLDDLQRLASSGRTSIPIDKDVPGALYRAVGYQIGRAHV